MMSVIVPSERVGIVALLLVLFFAANGLVQNSKAAHKANMQRSIGQAGKMPQDGNESAKPT